MLELSRLGIVAFLPGQLSDEAVAQPNEQSAGIVAIFDISSIFEHITAPKVSVHQSPWLVDNLTLDDLTDILAQLFAQRQELLV